MTGPGFPKAASIVVSERQRIILERWSRNRADVPHRLVERSHIVLLSAEGVSNVEQGRRLGVDRQRVRRWRQRWSGAEEKLAAAEQEASDADLRHLISSVLGDDERPGGPSRIGPEQTAAILAVACEPPEESGRPVTHWTSPELADEVVNRGIVDSITPRHIRRLLKRGICGRT